MTARFHEGWIVADYDGPDIASVYISATRRTQAPTWTPAFLDYADGARVAKIRTPRTGQPLKIRLRVNDATTELGELTPPT